jgi:hypothetical protein
MADNQLIKTENQVVENVIIHGDLSKLNPQQKIIYYKGFCERLGLDPFTQPFKLLKIQNREILYCDRSGTQQLSKLHKVSHQKVGTEKIDDVFIVYMKAFSNGRETESSGAVNIANLKGDALANAIMKAETKAKRRATLDLLGLGILDESEIETISGAQSQNIDLNIPEPKTTNQIEPKEIDYYEIAKKYNSFGELKSWRATFEKGTFVKGSKLYAAFMSRWTELEQDKILVDIEKLTKTNIKAIETIDANLNTVEDLEKRKFYMQVLSCKLSEIGSKYKITTLLF